MRASEVPVKSNKNGDKKALTLPNKKAPILVLFRAAEILSVDRMFLSSCIVRLARAHRAGLPYCVILIIPHPAPLPQYLLAVATHDPLTCDLPLFSTLPHIFCLIVPFFLSLEIVCCMACPFIPYFGLLKGPPPFLSSFSI